MIVFDQYIESTFQAVDDVVKEIISILKSDDYIQDKHIIFKINFMLREILNNAVEHGNQFDPNKKVRCLVKYGKKQAIFEIIDEGNGVSLNSKALVNNDVIEPRERQRGFQTILEMGFNISFSGNEVSVMYDFESEVK